MVHPQNISKTRSPSTSATWFCVRPVNDQHTKPPFKRKQKEKQKQLIKTLSSCWQSSFLNQKHYLDGFYQQSLYICSKYVLYTFLVETLPTRFCWLTWRICPKYNIAVRATCPGERISTSLGSYTNKQVTQFIKYFPENSPSPVNCSEK